MRTRKEAQAIIFNQDGKKVLIFKKFDVKFKKFYWRLVKGGVEEDETEEEGLKREILEETGLKNVRVLKKVHEYEYFHPDNVKHHVSVYLVKGDVKEKISLRGDEDSPIIDSKWMSIKEAKKLLFYDSEKESLKKVHSLIKNLELIEL